MMKPIPSPTRKREDGMTIANACQLRRQIRQLMCDNLRNLPFPLDATVHAGRDFRFQDKNRSLSPTHSV
jgi:hypothetical protein